MYLCIYVYVYIYMYAYIYIYVNKYVYIYIYMYMYIYRYTVYMYMYPRPHDLLNTCRHCKKHNPQDTWELVYSCFVKKKYSQGKWCGVKSISKGIPKDITDLLKAC